ncbi:hypothetical protein [Flavobacterium sp.]|jgi:hypothetical protein|uniref:hypothetical protein n=1 Tax=Flavobacterium sp. TaxID=239 RepID=UPI0037BF5326
MIKFSNFNLHSNLIFVLLVFCFGDVNSPKVSDAQSKLENSFKWFVDDQVKVSGTILL